MSTSRLKLGQIGEEAASAALTRRGYRILERNFRNIFGEIDIIARHGPAVCFIEVKTRATDGFGSPFESVTPGKQRKIANTAMAYLKEKGLSDREARFDVVGVFLNDAGRPRVEIIQNAFDLDERVG